jgi:hypothetical protein
VSENAGRRGRRWNTLKANQRAKRLPCCVCGQAIDYTLKHPDPGSFSVEHKKSWQDFPHLREDPANLDSAHLGCNSSKGKGQAAPSLGGMSEAW